MKCYSEHWLEPDGRVKIAHARGTESSRGYLPEVFGDPPSARAQLVSLGADFVFCDRELSDAWQAEIVREFSRVLGRDLGDPATADYSWWSQQVPLRMRGGYGDDAGELLHMVESETENLSTVVRGFASFRSRA